MSLSDTRIHQTELLLTLDYLLRYTDDAHPATQQDICRHATNFGLKYDPINQKGNDVKRQRIGDCLKFLMEVTEKYTDEVPFVLERTDSGKYYVEQKHYLSEEQVLKVLAAVKNDKYTQDEDTGFLIDRLLDSLSSVHKRNQYKKELKDLNRGVKKYDFETDRKIRLVNKALNEGKMLKIGMDVTDLDRNRILHFDTWFRVYWIKEFNNKPYAFLIQVSRGGVIYMKGYICDPIERLNIPKGPDKDVLCKDLEEHRDLDELYRKVSKEAPQHFDSLEQLQKESIMPISSKSFKVGFYFRRVFLQFLKPSFEQYFSAELKYKGCVSYDIIEEEEVEKDKSKDYIVPHPLKEGEKPEFYAVNLEIDPDAFFGWIMSDLHGNGNVDIATVIEIAGPSWVKESIYYRYLDRAYKYEEKLPKEKAEKIKNSVLSHRRKTTFKIEKKSSSN